MCKNIENNKRRCDLIFDVMILGKDAPLSRDEPAIELGAKFSRHFYARYNKNDADFLENHGRILFVT
jgi:hypothetical protein